MHFVELRDVPPSQERCVVINLATELVSSLAVASALRHAGMPVLLVNCTNDPSSKALFASLGESWGFDTIDVRSDVHGKTLDHLFSELAVERILLLDSDAELRSANAMRRLRSAMEAPDVFGAGWVEEYRWLEPQPTERPYPVLYVQRPFIPCTMFRTNIVRYALRHGRSFCERFNTGPGLIVAETMSPAMATAHSHVASVYDTGAEIFHWLRLCGYRFEGPCVLPREDEVNHLLGVTRHVLGGAASMGTALDAVEEQCLLRLSRVYADLFPGFAAAVAMAGQAITPQVVGV